MTIRELQEHWRVAARCDDATRLGTFQQSMLAQAILPSLAPNSVLSIKYKPRGAIFIEREWRTGQ
jgi:hypothetical protein